MPHPLSVFRQKEAYCEKREALSASAVPRQGTAQPFVSQLYGEAFTAPPFLSASIVSADAHHGKCANENLPKSEYGSLLKGCRRSTNWNLFGRFDYPLIKKLHLFFRMQNTCPHPLSRKIIIAYFLRKFTASAIFLFFNTQAHKKQEIKAALRYTENTERL